jgi:hypothetical protein
LFSERLQRIERLLHALRALIRGICTSNTVLIGLDTCSASKCC